MLPLRKKLSLNQIQLLQTGVKTGSYQIRADGDYQYLATVVTQSGVPFKGSILPHGDLFNLFVHPFISAGKFSPREGQHYFLRSAHLPMPTFTFNKAG